MAAASTLLTELEAIIQARQQGNDAQHVARSAWGRSVSLVSLPELYKIRSDLKAQIAAASATDGTKMPIKQFAARFGRPT